MSEFLFECFSEEIPVGEQPKAIKILVELFEKKCKENNLKIGDIFSYYTPRRLTLHIKNVEKSSLEKIEEIKGPRIDAPEEAIGGFLKKAGLKFKEDAEIRDIVKKGKFYFAIKKEASYPAQFVFSKIIEEILQNFPWSKSMRWGVSSLDERPLRWIRPLRNILALWIENSRYEIIPVKISHLVSNDFTYGHRFMDQDQKPIKVNSFKDYEKKLKEHKVILKNEERVLIILNGLRNYCHDKKILPITPLEEKESESLRSLLWKKDAITSDIFNKSEFSFLKRWPLLNEIANLVEWPKVIFSQFDKRFLKLPNSVIATTIEKNQKSFVFLDNENNICPYFASVANLETIDNEEIITRGNEKVIRSRLSDALHFWEQDLKLMSKQEKDYIYEKLESLYGNLNFHSLITWAKDKPLDQHSLRFSASNIVFLPGLGTQGDRIFRLQALATHLYDFFFDKKEKDLEKLNRAIFLLKADLHTSLVKEFPELQGIIGASYAREQNEEKRIIDTIEKQYNLFFEIKPDQKNSFSAFIAFVACLDILAGYWLLGENEKVTSSKDPHGLRRQALKIVGIYFQISPNSWAILKDCLKQAFLKYFEISKYLGRNYNLPEESILSSQIESLFDFIDNRVSFYLRQKWNFSDSTMQHLKKLIDSSQINKNFSKKIFELGNDLESCEGKDTTRAFARLDNFLAAQKLEKQGINLSIEDIKFDLLVHDVEKILYKILISEDLKSFSILRKTAEYLNQYFDHTHILEGDELVIKNRFILLKNLWSAGYLFGLI